MLGSLRQWHWISAAVSLAGMLLFAITGITLNHAADIPAQVRVTSVEAEVPTDLLAGWQPRGEASPRLPEPVRRWLAREHGIRLRADVHGEWQDGDFYLPLPRPGGDAWLALEPETGALLYERSERGWVAYFNDLHKGRHTGAAWRWFIDVFALACAVFSVSGLLLLRRQAAGRPATWPLTGLGLLIPLLLMLLLVH